MHPAAEGLTDLDALLLFLDFFLCFLELLSPSSSANREDLKGPVRSQQRSQVMLSSTECQAR